MAWFRLGRKKVQADPGRQEALLREVRQRPAQPGDFAGQAAAIARMLDGDDGLGVAARILHEVADGAYVNLRDQLGEVMRRTGQRYILDRRNYRPLWRQMGPQLRSPLFGLPGGFHPYVHLSAAVTVLGDEAKRAVRLTAPVPVLAHVFEVFDLTTSGWEFGNQLVDVDGAALANRHIETARPLREAIKDPPSIPLPARELMRRNNVTDVYDPTGTRVVGGINLGAELRPALLV